MRNRLRDILKLLKLNPTAIKRKVYQKLYLTANVVGVVIYIVFVAAHVLGSNKMKNGQGFRYWLRDIIEGIPYWPHRCWSRIKCFWKWFPIIWNDHDWDCNYLYIIIKHKLKLMREHHEKDRVVADWAQIVHRIKIAELCLNRLIEDKYAITDYKEHQKKFPFDHLFDHRKKENDGSPAVRISTASPEASADIKKIYAKEEYLKKQDLETFAKIFCKYSRGWWS